MATQLFQPPHGSSAWFYAMVDRAKTENRVISEPVHLSPSLAAELLKQNPQNRNLLPAKYAQLLGDIREGRWVFNGEPILISEEGLLNDGQHRCTAAVEANIAIETMMTFGLARKSRVTVDQGGAKTAGHFLDMDGVENGSHVAAIGRMLLAYEGTSGTSVGGTSRVSSGEIRSRFINDALMARSATFASSTNRYCRKHAPPAIIGMCFYLFCRINPSDAEAYMLQVCKGENIRQKDPAYAVREALLRDRITRNEKIHVIFRGWNAFRQKRTLQLAKVTGNLPALI